MMRNRELYLAPHPCLYLEPSRHLFIFSGASGYNFSQILLGGNPGGYHLLGDGSHIKNDSLVGTFFGGRLFLVGHDGHPFVKHDGKRRRKSSRPHSLSSAAFPWIMKTPLPPR